MNGIFGRVPPVMLRGICPHHEVNILYKHDESGWFMGLVQTPDEEEEEEEDVSAALPPFLHDFPPLLA